MRPVISTFLTVVFVLSQCSTLQAAEGSASDTKPRKIQTEEFDKLRTKPNHVILDVRTPEEFKAGHVKGAVNLNIQDPAFWKKVGDLDRRKTYLVHCARGGRSARASDQLGKAGLTNVIDYTGGFEAWKKDGKPVAKD